MTNDGLRESAADICARLQAAEATQATEHHVKASQCMTTNDAILTRAKTTTRVNPTGNKADQVNDHTTAKFKQSDTTRANLLRLQQPNQ